ncbi:MAG: DUF4177 domain-containing protein [Alistipes sp.]|nr:DUF4177 domain-containing protein [Alistipes sp.]
MKKIAIIISLIAMSLISCTSNRPTGENIAWEYKILKVKKSEAAKTTEMLNEMSSKGWELVTSYSQIGTSIVKSGYSERIHVQTTIVSYVFKRPQGMEDRVVEPAPVPEPEAAPAPAPTEEKPVEKGTEKTV